MFSHGHQQHAGVRQLDGVPFDHYRVLQELGAGAFGTVSLVERVSDGKAFAAKEVLYSRCEHDEQWKAALDEVSVWTALCSTYHPSILQLVEVVHVENVSLHLVTELMSGGELAGALDHILMSEQNVRMIIVQIAAAIAHLHLSHSMAHRDIKPQNVLLDADGTCLVTDFGACVSCGDAGVAQTTPSCRTNMPVLSSRGVAWQVYVASVYFHTVFSQLPEGLARSLTTNRSLTQGVGTVHYMPPEAMDPSALYSPGSPGSSGLDRRVCPYAYCSSGVVGGGVAHDLCFVLLA
jgi:serine/threonine protein kinase